MNYLDKFKIYSIFSDLTWPYPLTYPTTPYTHPWMGESPQISNLQTEWKYLNSFKCYWIFTDLGGPPGGGGGWWCVKLGFGDDGMTGTMWGWQGQHGDDRDNMGMMGKMGKTPSIDPPINPPIHPTTHPWVGVSQQIINLQTELNYLD